jgi:endonuclease/exonuclease/phosphatase family metal-dependent hydrolase
MKGMRLGPVVLLLVGLACGGSLGGGRDGGDADVDVDADADADANADADVDAVSDGGADGGRDADPRRDADLGGGDADHDEILEEPPDPCARPTPSGHLRLVTFNIRAARTASVDAIAAAIDAIDPDVVGLQEVDVGTARSGGLDQVAELSRETGMTGIFAKTIDFDGGEYGIGLLSRFPILSHERLPLPGEGEPRALLVVELDIVGEAAVVAVTHLGLDEETRRQQVDAINGALSSEGTLALVGDFNFDPSAAPYATMTGAGWRDAWAEGGTGDGFTHSAVDPRARIDFVYLGAAAPAPACAEVPLLAVSDHLPVVITLPGAL